MSIARMKPLDTSLAAILAHDSAYWSCISAVEPMPGWKFFHNSLATAQ